jgi:hypothetical protein
MFSIEPGGSCIHFGVILSSIYQCMALQSFVLLDLGRFFSFLILYTVGRNLWTGDQPVARPLPTHRTAQTQNKCTQASMSWVGFEPTIPAFERAKTVHALDRAATLSSGFWHYSWSKWTAVFREVLVVRGTKHREYISVGPAYCISPPILLITAKNRKYLDVTHASTLQRTLPVCESELHPSTSCSRFHATFVTPLLFTPYPFPLSDFIIDRRTLEEQPQAFSTCCIG